MTLPKNKKKKLRLAIFFGSVVLLAVLLRIFVFEVYAVRQNSMMGTLLDGDKVFVNKLERKNIKKNDIAVFRMNGETMIKRCIATPGDEIRILHDSIFVNNRYQDFPQASLIDNNRGLEKNAPIYRIGNPDIYDLFGQPWKTDSFGPYVVPYRGMKITSGNKKLYSSIGKTEQYVETDTSGTYTVNNNYLFFIGDNRRHSTDSRNYGPVPANNVIGVAKFILYSKKKFFSNRLLKSIL